MRLRKVSDEKTKILLVLLLIIVAVSIRFLPLPPNFAPITAVAIFGGALLPRQWAAIAPLAAMILSDLVIGLHPLIWATWGSFAVIALLSSRFVTKISPAQVLSASVGSSILFFIVTNFAVWLEGRLYPPTFDGLLSSYINALPFFRNTLLGDLVFTCAIFGAYALVYRFMIHGQASVRLKGVTS